MDTDEWSTLSAVPNSRRLSQDIRIEQVGNRLLVVAVPAENGSRVFTFPRRRRRRFERTVRESERHSRRPALDLEPLIARLDEQIPVISVWIIVDQFVDGPERTGRNAVLGQRLDQFPVTVPFERRLEFRPEDVTVLPPIRGSLE